MSALNEIVCQAAVADRMVAERACLLSDVSILHLEKDRQKAKLTDVELNLVHYGILKAYSCIQPFFPACPDLVQRIDVMHTYRMPLDAARVASCSYEKTVTTSNPIVKSIESCYTRSMKKVVAGCVGASLVVCMTQIEKKMLQEAGLRCEYGTVHEKQGASREVVVFLRGYTKQNALFEPLARSIVGRQHAAS